MSKYKSYKSVDEINKQWNRDGIEFYAGENATTIHLFKIFVPQKDRNIGLGTKMMTELVEYADCTGKIITLSPTGEFGGSVKRLKKFYKRFGFVENKGKNKDFRFTASFYRYPQTSIRY